MVFGPTVESDTGPHFDSAARSWSSDTTGSLYLTRFPLGIESMSRRDQIAAGTAPAAPQDESLATMNHPGAMRCAIDFRKPGKVVYNLCADAIRTGGCDSAGSAYGFMTRWLESGSVRTRWYHHLNRTLTVCESRSLSDNAGTRARFDSSPKKVAPAELAADNQITAGARSSSVHAALGVS